MTPRATPSIARRARAVLALALLAAAPGATALADPANPPQMAPSRIAASLDAVARIRRDQSASGGCTAVLIAPDRALTAAHCARGPTSGPDAMSLIFRPGAATPLHRAAIARVQFHAQAAAVQFHAQAAAMSGALSVANAHTDVALLYLAEAVPADLIAPIPLAPVGPSPASIAIHGYLNPRTDILHGHEGCALTPIAPALYGSDCRVVSGLSGAPALSGGPGTWAVEGITVATVDAPPIRALIADVAPWPPFIAD